MPVITLTMILTKRVSNANANAFSNASLNKNSFNEVDFVYKYYNQIVEFILK